MMPAYAKGSHKNQRGFDVQLCQDDVIVLCEPLSDMTND